jgi:antirestriction protein ArdC
MDVYQLVTDKIIGMLETAVVPWRRQWSSAGLPRNLVTKKPYRGINVFLLSTSKSVSPLWLTLKQANELGGSVRNGEQSTVIVFWKIDEKEGEEREPGDGKRSADSCSAITVCSMLSNAICRKA